MKTSANTFLQLASNRSTNRECLSLAVSSTTTRKAAASAVIIITLVGSVPIAGWEVQVLAKRDDALAFSSEWPGAKPFDVDGYAFDATDSDDERWVFRRKLT